MRLATIRLGDRTAAVRVEGDTAVELGVPDVRAVLERGEWRSWAAAIDGPRHPSAAVDHAPLVPNPSKILCVGLNYRSHILEMGRELPTHPTLFAKFADTLMGARDDLVLPAVSDEVDWEAELGVVIGAGGKNIARGDALKHVFGYTVINDVSARDLQTAHMQFFKGKTLDTFCPIGPVVVTADEFGDPHTKQVTLRVNGVQKQNGNTSDMIFPIDVTIESLSRGWARTPKVFLAPGQVLRTVIERVGECVNTCVAEGDAMKDVDLAVAERRR
ncbi:MAG: fumarylacetoacetate hydrolase family protein [Chloroflexi bacterium]|nr:MAG: fumarylacetoacetate hydrolase family protein [Chloroflexota bacterium]